MTRGRQLPLLLTSRLECILSLFFFKVTNGKYMYDGLRLTLKYHTPAWTSLLGTRFNGSHPDLSVNHM